MTDTPQQRLYINTIQQCEEIALVPWTQVFVSFAFSVFFFVILQRLFPGNGILGFIIASVVLAWYIICVIVAVYRDYVFWHKHPNYDTFAQCLLNREYNDHLSLKLTIMMTLSNKIVSFLLRFDGKLSIKIFRGFMKLLYLFMAPVLIARGVNALAASIGYGWPFIYFWVVYGVSAMQSQKLQMNPGALWIAAAETLATSDDSDAMDAATVIQSAAEGALIESGEDLPAGGDENGAASITLENEPAGEEKKEETASPKDPKAKLNFFAEYADKSTVLPRLIFIVLYSVTAYTLVVSWDWHYDQNGISYSQAFSAFDVYRPTLQNLYDKRDQLTNEQGAYIASTWS